MTKFLILLAIFGLTICGCDANSAREKLSLMKIGLLYHEFYAANDRGPKDLAELKSFTPPAYSGVGGDDEILADAFKKIDQGEIIVVWNAKLFSDGDKNSPFILVYEKEVPTKGGLMVDAGCAINEVTAKQFAKMEMIPQAE